MADVIELLETVNTKVDALAAAVAALPAPAAAVDLTPVLTAIAALPQTATAVDLAPVLAAIAALPQSATPATDLTAVLALLADITADVQDSNAAPATGA